MRRTSRVLAACALISLAACGGSSKSNSGGETGGSDDGGGANNSPLPAECVLPPYTVHAARDGGVAAGSETFQVVGAAAAQVPLVPDKDQTLTYEEATARGESTDLVGYSLVFGDEEFGVDDVSLFGGYAPEAAGKSRGAVNIYPHTTTPLAVGDVITPQAMDALGMFTTLSNLGMDFKSTPDEYMAYTNSIRGSVTILALNDDAICLDVELAWDTSDLGTGATGTLRIKGILTAPLAPRTLPLG